MSYLNWLYKIIEMKDLNLTENLTKIYDHADAKIWTAEMYLATMWHQMDLYEQERERLSHLREWKKCESQKV